MVRIGAGWNQIRDTTVGLRHMEITPGRVKSAAVHQSTFSSAELVIIMAVAVTDVAVDKCQPLSQANISGVLSGGE